MLFIAINVFVFYFDFLVLHLLASLIVARRAPLQ